MPEFTDITSTSEQTQQSKELLRARVAEFHSNALNDYETGKTPRDEYLRIVTEHTFGLKQKLDDAEKRADYDGLTGSLNRPGFINRFNETMEIRNRESKSDPDKSKGSLLIIDMDHFKRVNDTLGHTTGDQFLIILAQVMESSIRPGDFVGRYGGEEFIIYINANQENSIKAADRIRLSVTDAINTFFPNLEWTQTISVGLIELPQHFNQSDLESGKLLEQNISEADRALYHSKQNGRNQITIINSQGEIESVNVSYVQEEDKMVAKVHYKKSEQLSIQPIVPLEDANAPEAWNLQNSNVTSINQQPTSSDDPNSIENWI